MKQSEKFYLPVLNETTRFHDLVSTATCKSKFIAHCNDGKKEHLKNMVKKGEDVLVLIGPEGDFSIKEIKFAKEHGFREISLGNSKLRTETAGVVACHIVNLVNE